MDSEQLLALADRVLENGPSREIDARIAHAVCWRWDGWEDGDICVEDRPLEYVIRAVSESHNSIWRNLPAYTASLDAGMTLANGLGGQVTFFKDGTAKAFLWQPYPMAVEAKAATPALALTASCLRALAALALQHDGD